MVCPTPPYKCICTVRYSTHRYIIKLIYSVHVGQDELDLLWALDAPDWGDWKSIDILSRLQIHTEYIHACIVRHGCTVVWYGGMVWRYGCQYVSISVSIQVYTSACLSCTMYRIQLEVATHIYQITLCAVLGDLFIYILYFTYILHPKYAGTQPLM